MKEPDIKKRAVEREDYFTICSICNKEISGSSTNSVKNNLKVHILTKHNGVGK